MEGMCMLLKYPCPYLCKQALICCDCSYYIPDSGDIEDMEESAYDQCNHLDR